MKKWPIILWGDPRLEAPNTLVHTFDEKLAELADEMFSTCQRAPGLGLAAPQIGINIRLAVLDLSIGRDPDQQMVLVNPVIVHKQGKTKLEEGCLSFPGVFTHIERPKNITVEARNLQGQSITISGEGLLAQALCHEIDHLDSILIIDHIRGLKRKMLLRKIEKLRKTGLWER